MEGTLDALLICHMLKEASIQEDDLFLTQMEIMRA